MSVQSKTGFMFELVLGLIVLGILLVAEYLHAHKAAIVGPIPTPITRVVISTAPGVTVTPQAAATPQVLPAYIYDITDLGLMFAAPGSLNDLDSAAVHLVGDQAVTSVGFSSKRLEAAGCIVQTAPLGIITYDTDKGGDIVASIAGQSLYYLAPKAGCKADVALLPLDSFKASLGSTISDIPPAKTAR
jgi:hypothetical protein